MGLRNWIVTKLNPAQPSISAFEPNAAPENITSFQEAYKEIEVIKRAVEIIINACVEIPFVVDGGPAKKIDKLLNKRPNPWENRTAFLRRAILDFILDGNAFFYYDGKDIYILPANDVEIISHPKTFVSHYNYLVSSTGASSGFYFNKAKKKETIQFETSEVIHVKADNDSSIYRGDSRLKSLERIIQLYYYLVSFQRQFFKNNAVPGVVLSTENVLSPTVKNRLLEHWKMAYTGLFDGARSPAILDGGLKVDAFSNINFQELDFENSVDRLQQDMAKALGVPYVMLKSGNNANIGANEVLFYNHTVLPILTLFASAFEHFFGGVDIQLTIKPDKKSITALQPDFRTQAMYYSTLVNTGIITPNEARDGLGYEKMPEKENDQLRIPQNIVGSAINPGVGGRPKVEDKS